MRVLLTTRGSSGHVMPLAPFGHALVRAGHEVLVAAQDHFEANVARTGLPFAAVGALRAEDWMPLLPEFAALRLDEGHDADGRASSSAELDTRGDAARAAPTSPTTGGPT